MACDHEHVSAGEKETRKPVEPSARNTDNFSILSSVLSPSSTFASTFLSAKFVESFPKRVSFDSITVARSVEERTFPINRAVFSKSVPSWLEWTNRVCLSRGTWAYISEDFDLGTFPTHGTNRAKNGSDRWAKNLEEERKGKRRKKKKRLGLEWLIELEKGKLMRGAGERLGNSISSRRQMFRCDSFLSSSSSSNASFFPSRQETITDEREWNLDGEIGKEGGGYLGFTVLRREPIEREPHRRDEFETAETIGCDR